MPACPLPHLSRRLLMIAGLTIVPALPSVLLGQVDVPAWAKTAAAPASHAAAPATATAAEVSQPAINPPLPALRGYCIVALKDRQFVKASPEFASVYDHTTYQFSTAQAKARFDAAPDNFAAVSDGCDVVHLTKSGQRIPGSLLRAYQDRFYFFQSAESWNEFRKNPAAYQPVPRPMTEEIVKAAYTADDADQEARAASGEVIRAITLDEADEAPVNEAKQAAATPRVFPARGCIVSFKNGRIAAANPEFSSTYQGQIYEFASAAAKDEFDFFPETFAPACGGVDPVAFRQTNQSRCGRYGLVYEGRLYFFTTEENARIFLANPAEFVE